MIIRITFIHIPLIVSKSHKNASFMLWVFFVVEWISREDRKLEIFLACPPYKVKLLREESILKKECVVFRNSYRILSQLRVFV